VVVVVVLVVVEVVLVVRARAGGRARDRRGRSAVGAGCGRGGASRCGEEATDHDDHRLRTHAVTIGTTVNAVAPLASSSMSWELSDDHELLRTTVREFAESQIAPHAAEWDRTCHFPVDVVHAMGELGLFGIVFPEQWGGGGGDFAALCVAIEELGRVDQSMGITLSAGVGLGANPIFRFGTDEQRAQWLPDLVAGRTLGAFGLTEPDGGSDAGATRTSAVLDGDHWVLNGSKAFITNCGTEITSIVTVTARTPDGISAFVVPAGTPGMIIEPAYDKLGWHASDTHGITFVDCRIPAENLLGAPGKGFRNFLSILDDGRIAISALALGSARACLDASVEYARSGTRSVDRSADSRVSRSSSRTSRSRWRTRTTSRTRRRG
jgi:alkylation response protein AidB-like acyl-CoA dehydrogenase